MGGWGGVGGYDQLCCPASPKLLLGLDLGLGCDNTWSAPLQSFLGLDCLPALLMVMSPGWNKICANKYHIISRTMIHTREKGLRTHFRVMKKKKQ